MNKIGIFVNFWEKSWTIDYKYYIDKINKLGYDILEFQAQPLLKMSEQECKEIKNYADERGVELSYSLGLDPQFDVSSIDKKIRDRGVDYMKRIVEKIQLMDGKLFSGVTYAGWGVPNYFIGEEEKKAMLERSVNSMKDILKNVENTDLILCVEAVNRFESVLINTAKEAVEYVDLVASKNLGVHLDTYHMNIEENNISDAILLAGDKLKHFHLGENNRNIPSKGHINWNEIFQALNRINYQGRIVSEPFIQSGNEVGYDIRVWRNIVDDCSEKNLDCEAKLLLEFVKNMFQK